MPIQHRARYRVLADLLDTSFGKSSETRYPNHYIKMTMPLENTIQVKAQIKVILPSASTNVYNEMRKKYREEILDVIGAKLKNIAEQYKVALAKKKNAGNVTIQPYEADAEDNIKLSVQSASIQEWIEWTSMSAYRTEKTAIYHLNCIVDVT